MKSGVTALMKSVDLFQVYISVVEIKSVFKKKPKQLVHNIWRLQNYH